MLWWVLLLSWPLMLWLAWDAFATLPSPERLEQSRMVRIPTLSSMLLLLLRSAAELGTLLLLLRPRASRAYTTRLAAAPLALVLWFVLTTPLSLSAVTWVHRRWLAFLALACAAALLLHLLLRMTARSALPEQVQDERRDVQL